EPGPKLRLVDWAEYFCRYARDMRPFGAGPAPDLPGDNVAFSRARLVEIADALETGYWEPVAHPQLQRRGVTLWQSPELVVAMGPPELSVVVASVNGLPYVADCLAALERNAPGAEVILADSTDAETRAQIRDRFPQVKLLTFDEQMTVPELRAAGIFASTAPY